MSLLEVTNLKVEFRVRGETLPAVRDVSFALNRRESLGIVGESGSGKSVSVSALMGLVPSPPGVISGEIAFDGVDMLSASPSSLRTVRGNKMAMIFQDPMTSLNPHMRIIDQVAEPLRVHQNLSRKDARQKAIDALDRVGIPDASTRAFAWPHEFSGGMRQRVMIAMAMITEPDLLIADEPTTALDVTVQRQILELLHDLQQQTGMGLILISHDLAVVADVCDRVMVMWNGEVVEEGATESVLRNSEHRYTKGLLQCHPGLHEPGTRLTTLEDVLDG